MKILITGGSGTLGSSLCELLSLINDVEEIVIFSRSEDKQILVKNKNISEKIRYVIGDVRDYPALLLATRDMNLVIHTAAIKHIDIAEENPLETAETNIVGLVNVVKASKINKVNNVFFISTDKASLPSGIYGVSKLMGEKIAIASSDEKTKMSIFRFGNIIGSSGSIFQRWPEQIKKFGTINVTDKRMTRFFIDKNDAASYIVSKIGLAKGKEIFIPKMDKKKIFDIAMSFVDSDSQINVIGARTSEKIHENILSKEEYGRLIENDKEYIILPGDDQMPDITSGGA